MEEFKDENLIEAISGSLARGDYLAAAQVLSGLHASEIARIITGLDDEVQALEIYRYLDSELASEVLIEFDDRIREAIVSALHSEELIDIVDEMETDDAADVISDLLPEEARQVLDGIEAEDAAEVQKLLAYPEDTAGGKMQAELVSIHEDESAAEAIEEIRRNGAEISITNIFVVDSAGKLTGVLPLDKLILAAPTARISDIAERKTNHVRTDLDQEEVAKIFRHHDLLSMPVVDADGKLVGRITVDDVVDVIEEEIFEDFYKMAGINKEERVHDRARRSLWMRVPWLFVNLGTAFLAASVIKVFEDSIEQLVLLAVLMPIVAGLGGNAGTQTITVMVRGLALGELKYVSTKKVLKKEAAVGLFNGLLLGSGATVIAFLLGAPPMVGVLLFIAMVLTLITAGLAGAFIPLVLRWLKIDPAISSSIFVTACTDIAGFMSFLGIATLFIKFGLL
ncbi:MAG: magnesium transporter [Proteobacteria bacterium]|nr:magnesium transporter [Pseudomonadota bacterium]